MSKTNTHTHDHEWRIDWDLHEFGPREPAPAAHIAHGPTDPVRLLLALAVAHGDVPPNTPTITNKAA